MPENSQSDKANLVKYWRLFELSLAAIFACSIAAAISILHNPEWNPHLVRLLARSWNIFVAQDVGSTGRGFLNGGLEAVFTVIVVAAMIGYLHGFAEFRKHVAETAIIALFAIPTVAALVYGTQFAWEIAKSGYQDHHDLASAIANAHVTDKVSSDANNADLSGQIRQLQEELKDSQSQLRLRKQMLQVGDPAFQNMTNTIRAFMTWRRNIGYDAPCRILVTSPDKEDGGLYMTFITFAVFGSNCANGDLNNVGVKPENIETETSKGMIPGVVVFHALPDAKGANQLQTELENLFQVKRAYTIPGNTPENTIWLQFGTGLKWNTERIEKTK